MNKNEYIAISQPYDLKCQIQNKIYTVQGLQNYAKVVRVLLTDNDFNKHCFLSDCKPICFPLSSLSKKIQIKDYNDGKPFVPIVELSTLFHLQMYQFINGAFYDNNYGKYIEDLQEMPFNVVQTLLSWHFAISLSESEFIPVTEDFNPYK